MSEIEKMKLLNKAQANELFQHEAVLIGTEDSVPWFRVVAMFGEGAAEHARNLGNWNGYGVGDYTLMYLTYRGFLAAASFYNVRQLQAEAVEAEGKQELA